MPGDEDTAAGRTRPAPAVAYAVEEAHTGVKQPAADSAFVRELQSVPQPRTEATNGTSVHAPDAGENMNAEQQAAYWRAAEPAVLEGLLGEGSEDDGTKKVDVAVCEFQSHQSPLKMPNGEYVVEDGKRKTVPLRVRFRRIHDKDVEAANRKATRWIPNRSVRNGPKEPEVDAAVARCWLIYEATVPEDKATIWDQPALWSKHRVGNGPELVEALLDFGEKMNAVATIYGFSNMLAPDQMSEEDAVKNASSGRAKL